MFDSGFRITICGGEVGKKDLGWDWEVGWLKMRTDPTDNDIHNPPDPVKESIGSAREIPILISHAPWIGLL
jgi:hypothetical protein